MQGIIIGATFAFLGAIFILNLTARAITTTANGWSKIRACGQPDNGVLVRAACAKALPAVNVFEEAAYWRAARDASGRKLSGTNGYVIHFPAGQLPPNDAFWSLTATDTVGYMVKNAAGRSSVDSRSAPRPTRTVPWTSTFSAKRRAARSRTGCPFQLADFRLCSAPVCRESRLSMAPSDGPQIVTVPEMGDRYYSLQFTAPSSSASFAYVGTRATGTAPGEYLLSEPGWKGTVPAGMRHLPSASKTALVIGRVFVANDSDQPTAYGLARQIQLAPLRA